ncbi:MAG: Uma2 family endonuclease [Synechococcaceae cyanobacterium SM2_3_1]|nr:Uma2 family endonuclease [Synechococcaceae cyanobacterium SM2_3_1]
MTAITLNLSPVANLTGEQFQVLCAANPEAKLELNASGELVVMSPTGGETGAWNFEFCTDLGLWNRQCQQEKAFDSSTGFSLPNGAERSPDAAWIPLQKWNALTPEEKRGFLPLCPDFVMELLSPSDSWVKGLQKMEEYMNNGCRLGWLIDPQGKHVAIHRAGQPVEIKQTPASLSGEDVLAGFGLDLETLWN